MTHYPLIVTCVSARVNTTDVKVIEREHVSNVYLICRIRSSGDPGYSVRLFIISFVLQWEYGKLQSWNMGSFLAYCSHLIRLTPVPNPYSLITIYSPAGGCCYGGINHAENPPLNFQANIHSCSGIWHCITRMICKVNQTNICPISAVVKVTMN